MSFPPMRVVSAGVSKRRHRLLKTKERKCSQDEERDLKFYTPGGYTRANAFTSAGKAPKPV